MSLLTQTLSAVCWVLYASFFEWYWHKLWMHTPRIPKEAFHGHTIVHHGIYKGDDSFFLREGDHPKHILLKPYALPGILLAHLPILYLIERFVCAHTMIGGLMACTIYFVVYEYMHWNMHIPRGHFVERFRWFQFLRSHHHLHHRYFMKNFCVLFPLADWVMGTMATEESLAQRRVEREEALARGERYVEPKQGLARLSRNSKPKRTKPDDKEMLARRFAKSQSRRVREKAER